MARSDAQVQIKRLRLGTLLTAVAAVLMLVSAIMSESRFAYLAAGMLALSAAINFWALGKAQRP